MKSLVEYLQKHLDGEVLVGDDVLAAFSRDAGLLSRQPRAVVYARHIRDVRRCLLFLSQLAAKGGVMPLTVRGAGSDLSGAAVGSGIVLVMPAYMNRLLSGNVRRAVYRVEAGIEVGDLKSLLADASLGLPQLASLPPSATLGGSVANNASSRYSGKYGCLVDSLRALRIVLANGEEVEITRLSRSQVKQKMTLSSFEGDIYRKLSLLFLNDDAPYRPDADGILGRAALPANAIPAYDLEGLCPPEGGLNLLPLFAGSQGTLGVITEVEFEAQSLTRQPRAVLLTAKRLESCFKAAESIRQLQPASFSFINGTCFQLLRRPAPFLLNDFSNLSDCAAALIVEFDDFGGRKLSKKVRQLEKIAQEAGLEATVFADADSLSSLDRVRTALGLLPGSDSGLARYICSGFRAAYLPPENWPGFYAEARLLFEGYKLDLAAFGDLASGQFSALPRFNLRTPHHRRRFLKLLGLYVELVSDLRRPAQLRAPGRSFARLFAQRGYWRSFRALVGT